MSLTATAVIASTPLSSPSKVELSIQKSRLYRESFTKVDCFEKLITLTKKKLEVLEKDENILSDDVLGLREDAVANYKRMIIDYMKLRDDALRIIEDIEEPLNSTT